MNAIRGYVTDPNHRPNRRPTSLPGSIEMRKVRLAKTNESEPS